MRPRLHNDRVIHVSIHVPVRLVIVPVIDVQVYSQYEVRMTRQVTEAMRREQHDLVPPQLVKSSTLLGECISCESSTCALAVLSYMDRDKSGRVVRVEGARTI